MTVHSFQWVQASLGIIVSLAMARIASSVVNMAVMRGTVRLDWLPFAWAFGIFLLLLQFSWNFVGLDGRITSWKFLDFIFLLLVVFNLYVAAVLILPASEAQAAGDMRLWHGKHGRWALFFIAIYSLLSFAVNWHFTGEDPRENTAGALFAIVALTAFLTRSRPVLVGATLLYLVGTAGILAQMIAEG